MYNRYYFWRNRAHNIIEGSYYNAIEVYREQKQRFLEQLELGGAQGVNDILQYVQEEALKMAQENLEEPFALIQSELEEYFGKLVAESNSAGTSELRTRFETLVRKGKEGKVNPDNIYTNMKKDLTLYLETSGIKAILLDKLKNFNITNNTDINNNLLGYARKAIFQNLQYQKWLQAKTTNYIMALGGYYKEEVLVKAFEKVLAQYNIKVQQLGSITNKQSQQIQIDIGLGKGNNNIDLVNLLPLDVLQGTVTGNGEIQVDDNFLGGIQSKSWINPLNTTYKGTGNKNRLFFGNHSYLIPEDDGVYYWHAGVARVMENLLNVIGRYNFIFSTGDNIYFTCDLLTQFHQAQYVLAFYKRKTAPYKITSGEVMAMEHYD